MGSVPVIEQDVYVGQDFYVPAYRVMVRGKELIQVESDVLSVTYTDSDSGKQMDSFDLTVNNWDPDGKGQGHGWFKYSDSNIFDPWQDVELYMGYYHNGNEDLRRILVGEIVRTTPTFPTSGASTMTVHCVSLLQRFRTFQVVKDYFQKKDSWIARDLVEGIAKDIRQKIPGLDFVVDDEEINRNLSNENEIKHLAVQREYAINFLYERSRKIGYDIWLDERVEKSVKGDRRVVTFHYAPSKYLVQPTYILEWGKSLVSFQPSFGTANQPDEVILRYWNPVNKQKFEGKATRAELLKEGVLDPTQDFNVKSGPLAKKTEIVTDVVVESDDEAKQVAMNRLRIMAQGILEGKGKTVGLPDLVAGCKIKVVGLGRYDGIYSVTSTTHTIGEGGYNTDFSARREK